MAQSHQRPFSRRQLAVIAKIAFIEAMALSLIIPTISSTGEIITPGACNTTNGLCGPIKFDVALSARSNSTNTLTTNPWISAVNETMIVVSSTFGFNPSKVTSVTDTFGDTFTRLYQLYGTTFSVSSPNYDLEVWTGKTVLSGTNTVTANWNITDQFVLQVSTYLNTNKIGNSTSLIQTLGASSISTTLTTLKSGSWIIGIVGERSADNSQCPPGFILTSTFFIRRIDTCVIFTGPETEISDNATSLRNGQVLTFNPSIKPPPEFLVAVELELTPSDLEPQQQNIIISNFCQTIGPTCHLNFATKTSGINTAQSVFSGTTYCTGITTTALTTTAIHSIQLWANYAGADLNTTGATNPTITIFLKIGTTAPSTSFGSGVCASGGIVEGTGTLQFGIVGPLTPTTTFSTGINGWCTTTSGPCNVASTFYGWLEIVPHNFSGHMSFDQVNNVQADGVSSISMMEIN